jgi:hypothetical protein
MRAVSWFAIHSFYYLSCIYVSKDFAGLNDLPKLQACLYEAMRLIRTLNNLP